MKKITVIMPNGDKYEIEEQYLQDAINQGAKLYQPVTVSHNGSNYEIDSMFVNDAIAQGASLVKKKGNGITPSTNGSEDGGPFSLQSMSAIAGAAINARPFDPLPVSENPYATELNRINKSRVIPDADRVKVYQDFVRSNPVVISPDKKIAYIKPENVPASFGHTKDGAFAYALDLQNRIYSATTQEELSALNDEFYTQLNLSDIDNNPATISVNNMAEINRIIHEQGVAPPEKQFSSVTPEVIELLKKAKESERNKLRKIWESDPNNRRAEARSGDIMLKEENWVEPITQADGYIDKAGKSLQIESDVYSGQSAEVKSGNMKSDLRRLLSESNPFGAAGAAKNLYHNEMLNNQVSTGIEALKYTDKTKYDRLTNAIINGKTISSTDLAEVTASGVEIINARNLEKVQKGEMGYADYMNGVRENQKIFEQNVYGRPDILQRYIGNIIADYYETKLPVGRWFISDKQIDAVPEEVFEKAGIDINRPESKSAIHNIKINEGILPFDNAIRKDGLLREAFRGFATPVKGIANTVVGAVGDITGLRSENDAYVEGQLQPIEDYIQQRGKYFDEHYGKLADAFNGAGQFVSQYLLMEAGSGLFGKVGTSLGGQTASPLLGTKIGNALLRNKDIYGSLFVPFMQSYDSYYKEALGITTDPYVARGTAGVNAMMESVSEQMFNNIEFGRQVVRDFSGRNFNKIAAVFDRGIFDDAAQKELKSIIGSGLKKSIEMVGKAAGGLAQEAFEEVPVQAANFITAALANPDAIKHRELLPELKDAFLSGLISFSIPSLIGLGGSFRKHFRNQETENDALMIAANNKGLVAEALTNMFSDGNFTEDEYNKKMQLLNTAAQSVGEIPKTYFNGIKLNEADRVKYLSLIVQDKYLRDENSKINDDAIKSANEKKIKEITEQKLAIINGEHIGDGKIFTDFDDTLFDTNTKKLTPFGEEIKAKIAAGEDVTVLTARDATKENIDFISQQLGIDQRKIQAGLTPEGKANAVLPGATFYDNDEKNLAAVSQKQGVNVIDSKTLQPAAEPDQGDRIDVSFRGQADIDKLEAQELPITNERGDKVKYADVEIPDLAGGMETTKAWRAKDKLIERKNILEKLVNCLTNG